jgi:sugar lactone lactonase YvrE
MKLKIISSMLLIALTAFDFTKKLQAPTEVWTVTTIAGTDDGNKTMDGPGVKAQFSRPSNSAIDAADNLYVLDDRICLRKVDTEGNVNTLLGTGAQGQDYYDIKVPELPSWPNNGLCIDKDGNWYVSSDNQHAIYKISPDKKATLFAGAEGYKGTDDGPKLQAEFYSPSGLCMDKAGNMYVADTYNGMVRKISVDGKVKTMAGNGKTSDFKPGLGKDAQFGQVRHIAVDSKGNVYVAQNGQRGCCVAKINPQGVATNFVGDFDGLRPSGNNDGTGKAAKFMRINALAVDAADNLIIGENTRVRKATPAGVVTTLAGNETAGGRDAIGTKAMFWGIYGLSIDSKGNILVSDGSTIRKMTKQ